MKINEIFSKLKNIYNMEQGKARDIQMLRLAIIAELDAANLYEQMAEYAYDADVATVLMDVANEEKQHIGEFEYLLEALDEDHEEYEDKGEEEIEDLIGPKESTMNLVDKYLGETKTYTDDDWVLVQNGKVVKYIKNPKNNKAPQSFTSSKNQEIIRVSKAKQMGICEGL